MDNHCRWCIVHHRNDVGNANNNICIKTDELVDGWSATKFGCEKMNNYEFGEEYDDWRTQDNYDPRSEDDSRIDDVRVLCKDPFEKGKCTNCGRHETSMLICATEDGVGNKFLGYIPYERKVEKAPVETRTGVTIKKGE